MKSNSADPEGYYIFRQDISSSSRLQAGGEEFQTGDRIGAEQFELPHMAWQHLRQQDQ